MPPPLVKLFQRILYFFFFFQCFPRAIWMEPKKLSDSRIGKRIRCELKWGLGGLSEVIQKKFPAHKESKLCPFFSPPPTLEVGASHQHSQASCTLNGLNICKKKLPLKRFFTFTLSQTDILQSVSSGEFLTSPPLLQLI